MIDHICAYNHCLHPGERVKDSEAVVIKGSYYHWDCAQTKSDINELKQLYISRIDNNVSVPMLAKVLNDLVLKYGLSIGYVRFAINHYADAKIRIKSPFTLLYLRTNKIMKQKYQRCGGENN